MGTNLTHTSSLYASVSPTSRFLIKDVYLVAKNFEIHAPQRLQISQENAYFGVVNLLGKLHAVLQGTTFPRTLCALTSRWTQPMGGQAGDRGGGRRRGNPGPPSSPPLLPIGPSAWEWWPLPGVAPLSHQCELPHCVGQSPELNPLCSKDLR